MAPRIAAIRPGVSGERCVFLFGGVPPCVPSWDFPTLSKEELLPFFRRTGSRGPDMSRILETPSGYLCFHRLAIMGLTEAGMRPFTLGEDHVVCNGEIYGFHAIRRELMEKGYTFQSGSDCEILLPMYREYGLEMFAKLDAGAPVGLLLSGGPDSSLVCAIGALVPGKRIRTFAIGMDTDPIDLKYARETADFLGAEHTEVT